MFFNRHREAIAVPAAVILFTLWQWLASLFGVQATTEETSLTTTCTTPSRGCAIDPNGGGGGKY
jgi:hypothetical protein